MTNNSWLGHAEKYLKSAGIGTARLDALVLLEDVTGRDRAWLLAHPETQILSTQLAELEKLLKRRARHEPLAYLRGKTEFYGREFVISPAVLEPRPESETMIDQLKELVKGRAAGMSKDRLWRLADIGTGSGALGITAALELPGVEVDLIDIDAKALQTAKINVDKFTLNIGIIKSDLLGRTKEAYDILLCNLPYVPDDYQINRAATQEPELAIFGGPDGLGVYRRLFDQISGLSRRPLYILTEALPPQHQALQSIAVAAGYEQQIADDFIQVFRRA
jgi:release factor glutamine methyltransferase